MTQLVDNLADFELYYNHTWISKPQNGKKIPCYVRVVGGTGAVLRMGLQDVAVTWAQLTEEYDFSPPPLGMINVGSRVAYLELIPQRQVKKGLTANRVFQKNFGGLVNFNDAALAAFNPEYLTFSNALDAIVENKKTAAAFAPIFCLERLENAIYPVLYYKQYPIGEVQGKEIIISPAYQEYEDRLRKYVPAKTRITLWKQKE